MTEIPGVVEQREGDDVRDCLMKGWTTLRNKCPGPDMFRVGELSVVRRNLILELLD